MSLTMVLYPYVASLTLDANSGNVVGGATGSVFAKADTTFTTPLPTVDASGNPVTLTSNANGVLPSFYVDGHKGVNWKSGEWVLPLVTSESVEGPEGPAGVSVNGATATGDDLVFSLSNGATTPPVKLPSAPGGSDAGVASYITTPGTETATALSATIVEGVATETPKIAAALTLPEAMPFLSRLTKGLNAVWLHLGDSTGAGNTTTDKRWVYQTAEALAAQFPTVIVRFHAWDDATLAYLAPVTVGTGAGPVTLDIYNASAPGRGTDHSLTHLAVMSPVAPHFTSISHGLNESSTSIASGYPKLLRGLRARYPKTPVSVVAQNPKTSGAADYADQLVIRQYITDLATRYGHGLLDVAGEFLADPDWATTLVQSDTIHPTTAGYKVWADFVIARLKYQPRAATHKAPSQPSVVRVPAGLFSASSGAPSYVGNSVDRPFGGWSLDPATFESVSTLIHIPHDWETVTLKLLWTVLTEPGGNTGAVTWQVYTYDMPTTYPGAYGTRHDLGAITSAAVPSSAAINKLYLQQFSPGTSYELTKRGPIALTVCRFANQAGDTLGIDAVLVGVDIERVD